MERDGTLQGPDVQTLADAAKSGAMIIASGGISSIEDIIRVRSAGCSSVILGKALYDGKISIERAKAVA
jgi:phosphoribosylformimino-5-aminoimidazole carboxamide ribotide isomerase